MGQVAVTPYSEYLHWAVYLAASAGIWHLPFMAIYLIAAVNRDKQRNSQCMKILVARKDPSYEVDPRSEYRGLEHSEAGDLNLSAALRPLPAEAYHSYGSPGSR
jgi:hypothetical protein